MGSNWFLTGLASAAGSFIGLIIGGAVGQSMEKGEGAGARVAGASVGALVGMAAGAFAGAAIAAPSPGPATVVNQPPAPPSPPVVVNPPPPPGPLPQPPAGDPILTDVTSLNTAKTNLASWWAFMVQQGQVTQNYQPVLSGNDPNFQPALAYFQQWVNANAQPADFQAAGISGVTALPYTDGTLDQYTQQTLAFAAANLGRA